MKLFKAPNKCPIDDTDFSVFLAGSIEMGTAENWQTQVENILEDYDVNVFNPRRDDWDSTWVQSWDNPKFVEQVQWEMDHLDISDLIIFYFDPTTKSPITLLELGHYALYSSHVIVCCPEGFWRKGNVDVFCHRYGIPVVTSKEKLFEEIKLRLSEYKK